MTGHVFQTVKSIPAVALQVIPGMKTDVLILMNVLQILSTTAVNLQTAQIRKVRIPVNAGKTTAVTDLNVLQIQELFHVQTLTLQIHRGVLQIREGN